MELAVLEESKNKLKIEIKGEDHTLCNALRDELNNDKNVEMAGYYVEHPLTTNPVFTVQGSNPKKALLSAVERLRKRNEDLREKFKKIK